MYGLKHEYFSINPKEEFQVLFARGADFKKFYDDLVATMDSGRIPRYVVFGLFGVGKTHFLMHLKFRITNKADAVYVETPTCHRRTSFIEFYRSVISAIGRITVMNLLQQGLKKMGKSSELGLSEDLGYVITNALKEKQTFMLWKFLSGEKLKATEAEKLEAVRPELTVNDAVAVINAMAILNERLNDKPLLFLVDEFENTMHLGGDARVGFTDAIRSLVDEGSRVPVVFALTARSLAEMPAPIEAEPVRRRIGVTNFTEFKPYSEDELQKFMLEVIQYRRDPKFNPKTALANLSTPETVDAETFPFSKEALKEILTSVTLFKEQGKIEAVRPTEALDMMDKALRLAIASKLPFIGKDVIGSVREEVVESLAD